MANSNTNILIKRSTTNASPGTLRAGELGYSYVSNTAYIGTAGGNGVLKIGGQYYTDIIDNRNINTTANTLVQRDANGNVYANYVVGNIVGNVDGTSNNALYLSEPQYFGIRGGDVYADRILFNGRNQVTFNASLNTVPGLVSGTYGSTTAIPVVTVAANGRVMNVTTASITTSFTAAADFGNWQEISGGDTLTIAGGDGISTNGSGGGSDTITIDVDTTVVRSNTPVTLQTIDGSVTVNGNLTVLGTQTTINTQTLNVADPIIYLASNNKTSDVVDIGFAGTYNDGSTQRATGVFRNAGNKEFYVFDNYNKALNSNNEIDVADASFRAANLNVGYVRTTGIISNGVNIETYIQGINNTQNTNITAVDTKAQAAFDKANNAVFASTDFTYGTMVVADGTDSLKSLANVSYTLTGSLANSKTITSLTVDSYGRLSAATGADIAIDTSQITSGTLGYSRGGTGSTSYTTGALLVAGASGLQSLSNTTYTQTGTLAANNTLTSITVDAYGRFTAATVGAISGLTVGQGGTGVNTFTTNGITYGNGTGPLQVTAAAGTADQTWSNQILTVTNAGVPVWSTALDGGQF
jgi:hypothetical protein